MDEIAGSGGGDFHVAQEIAGLKELVHSGDISPMTISRILILVERAFDRIWEVEQRLAASEYHNQNTRL